MFDKLMREVERLEKGGSISVPIVPDEHGFIDKECPADNCLFGFKVHDEDWSALFRDEAVFCPQCRNEAPANAWFTREQNEHGMQMAENYVANAIDGALAEDARAWDRTLPKRGMVTMSIKYSGPSPKPVDVPAPVRQALELEIKCDACAARFRVLGAAYFCPCCGKNLIERVFDDSIRTARTKADLAATVEEIVAGTGVSKDDAALIARSMIETAFTDMVRAFQAYAEEHYKARFPGAAPPPTNVFQRLNDGSALWRAARGSGYEAWLTAAELDRLGVFFQRRHPLEHKQGIVDEKYISRSGDTSYKPGQRLVIAKEDVHELADLIVKLVLGLRT